VLVYMLVGWGVWVVVWSCWGELMREREGRLKEESRGVGWHGMA